MQNLLAVGFAFPHPNDGTEKPVRPARVAARLLASRHMLSHFVFSWGMGLCPMFTQALALSYPNSKAAEPVFPARAAGSPSQRIKASA